MSYRKKKKTSAFRFQNPDIWLARIYLEASTAKTLYRVSSNACSMLTLWNTRTHSGSFNFPLSFVLREKETLKLETTQRFVWKLRKFRFCLFLLSWREKVNMSAKFMYSLSDENPDLQKQIGCMSGLFQLFDRHHFLGSRRIASPSHKRLPPGKISVDA